MVTLRKYQCHACPRRFFTAKARKSHENFHKATGTFKRLFARDR